MAGGWESGGEIRMRSSQTLAGVALLGACLAVSASAQEATGDSGLVTVHLADGSTLPLRNWSLRYSFVAWAKGTPRALARTTERKASELWVGKKTYPVAGRALVLERDKAGTRVEKLALVGSDGKREEWNAEAPNRDLLLPDGDKKTLMIAESLDFSGETLTGTRYSFCLLSYTSLVECGTDPGHRVLRLEFQ
jgi:hypothetical protein